MTQTPTGRTRGGLQRVRTRIGCPAGQGTVEYVALILLVAFMRDGVASTPFGAKNLAFLALIETAVCVLLAVAAQAIVLPLGIDGPALLATFAALTGFAASLRRAT